MEDGDIDLDDILQLVEDAPEVKIIENNDVLSLRVSCFSHSKVKEMDEVQVKQLCLKLQRSMDENLELRTKYPTEPQKFLDSEVELDEAIQALQGWETKHTLTRPRKFSDLTQHLSFGKFT